MRRPERRLLARSRDGCSVSSMSASTGIADLARPGRESLQIGLACFGGNKKRLTLLRFNSINYLILRLIGLLYCRHLVLS
jgi:hypothetical protein